MLKQFFGAIAGLALLAGSALAADIHVPADYANIQDALNAAQAGDTVLVAPGTYVGTIDFPYDPVAGAGVPVTLRSTDGPEATILDGDAFQHVVAIHSGGGDSVLEGFTITNGWGSSICGFAGCFVTPGGLWIAGGARPTIRNCHIVGNAAPDRAAGCLVEGSSSPLFEYCLFFDNDCPETGAGMLILNSSPTIDRCTVTGNIAFANTGGIEVDGGDPLFTNSIIWGNEGAADFDVRSGNPIMQYTLLGGFIQPPFPTPGVFDADPMFTDFDEEDFTLQALSPCIDAGDPTVFDDDGSVVDLGAFPYVSPVVGPQFVRGDVNQDNNVNIADGIGVLDTLFSGAGDPDCVDSADANDDGTLNIADAIYILSFLFQAGSPAIPAPSDSCGVDPTDDTLECELFNCPTP